MSSKASLTALVLALPLAAGAGYSHAGQAGSVCPAKPQKQVTQIYLFDGRPADKVLLAPDDDAEGANTYTVRDIYRRGSVLTVRCEYGAHDAVDIRLKKRVAVCTYSEAGKQPALRCK